MCIRDRIKGVFDYRIRIWIHIESRTFSLNLKRDSMWIQIRILIIEYALTQQKQTCIRNNINTKKFKPGLVTYSQGDERALFLEKPVIVSYTLQTSFFKYFNVFGWRIKKPARPDQLRTHKIFNLKMDTLPRDVSASRIRFCHNKITNMTDI